MNEHFRPHTDELVANNANFAQSFGGADLPGTPTRNLAVVACMDSRLDPYRLLGIDNGEVHMIRNAGGIVTDDVVRSLCLSQRLLGTREVLLIHHTDCGLQKVDEADFRADLEAELGVTPPWSVEGFSDPHADVAQSIRRLLVNPFLPHKENIRGFVYDVADGVLDEVTLPEA